MDVDAIAAQFVTSFYTLFDSDRSQTAQFYVGFVSFLCLHIFLRLFLQTDQSTLSFEGVKFQGPQAIGDKLKV